MTEKHTFLYFVYSKQFKEIFDTMPSSNYKMSLAVTKSVVPNFVVELVYNQEENLNFQSIKGKNKVISAFHGSSVENFYSILVHGLTNSLNKVSFENYLKKYNSFEYSQL